MADVATLYQNLGTANAATTPDGDTNVGVGATKNVEVHTGTGGAGVIGITNGTVLIQDSGAALLTLAAPVAGSKQSGGNDGDTLTIISGTAHAHTVTTPANGINGADHVATFSAVADRIELVASNGVWLTKNNNTTLS